MACVCLLALGEGHGSKHKAGSLPSQVWQDCSSHPTGFGGTAEVVQGVSTCLVSFGQGQGKSQMQDISPRASRSEAGCRSVSASLC